MRISYSNPSTFSDASLQVARLVRDYIGNYPVQFSYDQGSCFYFTFTGDPSSADWVREEVKKALQTPFGPNVEVIFLPKV